MESVVSLLDRRAQEHPDQLAYVFLDSRGNERERLTYRELVARTHLIGARLLDDHGMIRGDRILLSYPPGLEMIATFFACARAGFVAVPVPPMDSDADSIFSVRIAHIAADCGARALLTSDTALLAKGKETAAALLTVATGSWAEPSGVPVAHTPHEIALIQYTSGSTRKPRGVMVTHGNILANCRDVVDHDAPVCVTWLPQHHDMGLIGYYLFPILSGGTTYGFAPATFLQRPLLWLEAMSRYRATASSAPNFAFEHVLRSRNLTADWLERVDLSPMRFLMAAAEPVRPETYSRFLQIFRSRGLETSAFFVAYGLAESTLAVTNHGRRTVSLGRRDLARGRVRITRSAAQAANAVHLMSCGPPVGATVVAIVDPQTLRRAQPGQVGEVWVAGPSVSPGYWGERDGERAAFGNRLDDGGDQDFLRTGDLGFMHDGELVICGRAKDMIILRGQNYFPQDIEQVAMAAVPEIRAGCAAAFEVERDGEPAVVLIAEVRRTAHPDPVAAVRAVRTELGLDLAEVVFIQPQEIPQTSSGKVMRFRAREMFQQGRYTVLARYSRDAGMAASEGDPRPFMALLARYQLQGDEDHLVTDTGIDSLDVVMLLHELQELLTDNGCGDLVDDIDSRLLQQMSIAMLVELGAQIAAYPRDDGSRQLLRARIAEIGAVLTASEQDAMRADAEIAVPLSFAPAPRAAGSGGTLITGATGFLGPFLLASLVEQSSAPIVAAVRAGSEAEARARLAAAIARSGLEQRLGGALEGRIEIVCCDLEKPRLGFAPALWDRLAHESDAIFHNGALVNYVFDYKRMRRANVEATAELLRFGSEGRPKAFNYISTTFIYGWATKDVLHEADSNAGMELLDFGYSQSKWVAERLVARAAANGLTTRIFRPALITPSATGQGGNLDITIRLLTFMLTHGIGVSADNQVSFLPADYTADSIVGIASLPDLGSGTFNVTRDEYQTMRDVTDEMARQTGRHFKLFALDRFVPEVLRRCGRDDILFPLLDFLVGSVDNIAAMEFKRYDNSAYREARSRTRAASADPSLEVTVTGILAFMNRMGIRPA